MLAPSGVSPGWSAASGSGFCMAGRFIGGTPSPPQPPATARVPLFGELERRIVDVTLRPRRVPRLEIVGRQLGPVAEAFDQIGVRNELAPPGNPVGKPRRDIGLAGLECIFLV